MKIFYQKSNFLKALFPEVDINDDKAITAAISDYVKEFGFSSIIKIDDDSITVVIADIFNSEFPQDFYNATNLCSQRRFVEARPIFEKLIEENPFVSEYYRNLAQTYEEEKDYETAINLLIDALRWDPTNEWALLLMGNIYSRYFNDVETAMTYYDQVVVANPENFIALNNIGGAFLQSDKPNYAERYLSRAYNINPNYPNTSYGLALSFQAQNKLNKGFFHALNAIKNSEDAKSPIYLNAITLALDLAKKISEGGTGKEELVDFISQLEEETGKEIRMEKDDSIPTAATVQIAENHGRDYHLIKYKDAPGVDHLILHELVHIHFYQEARAINENKLFIVFNDRKQAFRESYKRETQQLIKLGYPSDQLNQFMDQLHEGIMRQVFNTPIDLFIEDYIFKNFPTLKASQFLSLYKMNLESHQAVSNPQAVDLIPKKILSQSKVFNVLTARHFEDLFGLKMEEKYSVSSKEQEVINQFWNEFLEYRNDREPGEEYELIMNWGKDLELESYFELKDENLHNEGKSIRKEHQNQMDKLFQSPFESDLEESEQKEMDIFLEEHSNTELNLPVTFYMIGALEYFSDLPVDQVRETAIEIALLGRTGISPEKKGYRINKIPGEVFSGYRLLAFYYTSFSIAFPELLSQLGMPFEKEFDLAKSLFKKK